MVIQNQHLSQNNFASLPVASEIIGEKMNQVNEPLYNLTLDAMEPEKGDLVFEIGFGTGKFFNLLF